MLSRAKKYKSTLIIAFNTALLFTRLQMKVSLYNTSLQSYHECDVLSGLVGVWLWRRLHGRPRPQKFSLVILSFWVWRYETLGSQDTQNPTRLCWLLNENVIRPIWVLWVMGHAVGGRCYSPRKNWMNWNVSKPWFVPPCTCDTAPMRFRLI